MEEGFAEHEDPSFFIARLNIPFMQEQPGTAKPYLINLYNQPL